jgi:hypothetical protein
MVSIMNFVLYLKGFSKHCSNHFIFSGYKLFLSSFSSTKSKKVFKVKIIECILLFRTRFSLGSQWSHISIKKYPEILMPFYSLNFSKSFYFTAINSFTHCILKTQNSVRIDNPFLCAAKYRLLLSDISLL